MAVRRVSTAKYLIGRLQRLTRLGLLFAAIAIILHVLLSASRGYEHGGIGEYHSAPEEGNPHTDEVEDASGGGVHYPVDPDATLWQLMLRDRSLAGYVELLMPFDDIKGHLDNASEIYTIYAPVNAAFEAPAQHPADAPEFYFKFIALNHMGPNNVSLEDLEAGTTAENFINHDDYFTNLQRISTKGPSGELLFNQVARYVGRPLRASNGFVHHIDRLLYLPDSVGELIRASADLQTLHRGLHHTSLSLQVNDTQSHLSQTLFAPTETAFARLGPRLNKFLFSSWGTPYLRALLGYHVVMNHTLFTDTYFLPNRSGQVPMGLRNDSVSLPTLLRGHNLTARIVMEGQRQTIELDGGLRVSEPDVVRMDGVVHKVDRVMFPPRLGGEEGEGREGGWGSTVSQIWGWLGGGRGREMGIEELMERLQPLVDAEG